MNSVGVPHASCGDGRGGQLALRVSFGSCSQSQLWSRGRHCLHRAKLVDTVGPRALTPQPWSLVWPCGVGVP